jgi:hypothetical protein
MGPILVSFYDFSFYDPVLLEPNPVVKRVLPVEEPYELRYMLSHDTKQFPRSTQFVYAAF